MLFPVLTSNQYQKRLCQKFNLLDLCIGVAGQPLPFAITNKALADVFEVNSIVLTFFFL